MAGDNVRIATVSVIVAISMMFVPIAVLDLSTEGADAAVNFSNPYYEVLDSNQKAIYDKYVTEADAENLSEFVVTAPGGYNKDSFTEVYHAFFWSNPQYFWIDHVSYNYTPGSNEVEVTFEPTDIIRDAADPAQKIDELQSLVDDAVDEYVTSGLFRYQLVKGFHDKIVNDCKYDSDAAESVGGEYDKAFDILGVFVDHEAVCQGYSMAMKYLCDIAGIPCINVSGNAYSSPGAQAESHMWNYIMMDDGLWYCIDVTWDDPIVKGGGETLSYDFFLVGSDTVIDDMKFIESHVPDYTGETAIFNTYLPSTDKSEPYRLSSADYHIRPGSEGDVEYVIGDGGEDPFRLDKSLIDPSDPNNILEKLGPDGKAVIITKGIKFYLSVSDLGAILDAMEASGNDSFLFGCVTKEVTLDGLMSKDHTKISYAPYISNGSVPILDLDTIKEGMRITIALPYEPTDNDVIDLIRAWTINSNGDLNDEVSSYSDGYVTLSVSQLDKAYVVTSNPIGDFSPIWVFAVFGVVLVIVLIIVFIFLKAIFKVIKR